MMSHSDQETIDAGARSLIDSIKGRVTETRWGIGTVTHYLKSCEAFLDETLRKSADWGLALKRAETLLSWCDEEMCDANLISKAVKAFGDGSDVPEGFCATIDGVLTSNRKDRDGDVLEPKGMIVNQQMALLWQHIPVQPTGRCLRLNKQDETAIDVKWGLVDTAFGRDNAILCKAGCLRFSHGFKPYEFEPIAHKSAGDGVASGWRVKRGEIREGSLVSIPSNVDGVITAFSQGKLSTPLMKNWAQKAYDARPTIIPVTIDLTLKTAGGLVSLGRIPLNAAGVAAKGHGEDEEELGKCPQCGADGESEEDGNITCENGHTFPADDFKSAKGLHTKHSSLTETTHMAAKLDLAAKGIYCEHEMDGSHEHIRESLQKGLPAYCLKSKLVGDNGDFRDGDDGGCNIISMFPDYAIFECGSYSHRKNYRAAYTTGVNGAEWSGEPKEVKIKPTVEEKAYALAGLVVKNGSGNMAGRKIIVKAGRTLSSASRDVLSKLRDAVLSAGKELSGFIENSDLEPESVLPAAGVNPGSTVLSDAQASAHINPTDPDSPDFAAAIAAELNKVTNKNALVAAAKAIAACAIGMGDQGQAAAQLDAAQATLKQAANVLREQRKEEELSALIVR